MGRLKDRPPHLPDRLRRRCRGRRLRRLRARTPTPTRCWTILPRAKRRSPPTSDHARGHPDHPARRQGPGRLLGAGRPDRRGTRRGARPGFRIDPGPPDPPTGTPRLPTRPRPSWRPATAWRKDRRGASVGGDEDHGMQITGGSTTVPDSFVKLRHGRCRGPRNAEAGGCAKDRHLPGAEDRGRPVRLPDGSSLIAYTELAADRGGPSIRCRM
jgi:hypothetical protein